MKNYLKTSKWLRWATAGVFGVMLVLNIMVSIEFEKDKILPTITLTELGNVAYANSEGDDGGTKVDWYYHPCIYSYPHKECKTTNSAEHCGKAKKRPGLACP